MDDDHDHPRSNVSRAGMLHWERSTARVNRDEHNRTRRRFWRRVLVALALVGFFVAGTFGACAVRM